MNYIPQLRQNQVQLNHFYQNDQIKIIMTQLKKDQPKLILLFINYFSHPRFSTNGLFLCYFSPCIPTKTWFCWFSREKGIICHSISISSLYSSITNSIESTNLTILHKVKKPSLTLSLVPNAFQLRVTPCYDVPNYNIILQNV